jgi:hypothetical protein
VGRIAGTVVRHQRTPPSLTRRDPRHTVRRVSVGRRLRCLASCSPARS